MLHRPAFVYHARDQFGPEVIWSGMDSDQMKKSLVKSTDIRGLLVYLEGMDAIPHSLLFDCHHFCILRDRRLSVLAAVSARRRQRMLAHLQRRQSALRV